MTAIDYKATNPAAEEQMHGFVFESYGVTVRVESNDPEMIEKLRANAKSVFLDHIAFIDDSERNSAVVIILVKQTDVFILIVDDIELAEAPDEPTAIRLFRSRARIAVAENARSKVFVHSAVVGWKGKAILFPGNSYAGKTTLVMELVRRGFDYFSDEYAILDENGMVHPFPGRLYRRPRLPTEDRVEVSLASLGGRSASESIVVGMAVFTEFHPDGFGEMRALSLGKGIQEIIPHTIPIRLNTQFALKVLNNTLSNAIILKGSRGEASSFADNLVSLAENI